MKTSDIQDWTEIQGVLLDGKYPLVECVSQEHAWALFQTITENVTRNVRVRFAQGAQTLTSWKKLQRSPHPQLVPIFDTGTFPVNGSVLEYVVLEHWDDTLASVLPERELTSAEASEMLESIVPAVAHLHSLGLVHGCIEPARIVSAGSRIKLDFLAVQPVGSSGPTPADDIAALGTTLEECLTRQKPSSGSNLPEPFGAIVRRCLRDDPSKRPSANDVLSLLHGEYIEPAVSAPVAETVPPQPTVSKRPVLWAGAGLIAAAVGVVALVTHHSTPPAPVAKAPAAAVISPASTPKPSASSPASAPTTTAPVKGDWRVIAFTYNKAKDAQQKAERLNAKWPEAHAEVFSPGGGRSPYLVAVGGRMTRDEAARFRKRAVSHGLPGGTYTQNFTR